MLTGIDDMKNVNVGAIDRDVTSKLYVFTVSIAQNFTTTSFHKKSLFRNFDVYWQYWCMLSYPKW